MSSYPARGLSPPTPVARPCVPSLSIRDFRATDAKELSRLATFTLWACNREDYLPEGMQRVTAELKSAELAAMARRRTIVVALQDRVLVGTGSLERNWVHALFVEPSMQRQGVGSRIIEHLEQIVHRRGYDRLRLYSTHSATGFYTALGFEASTERVHDDYGTVTEMNRSIYRGI